MSGYLRFGSLLCVCCWLPSCTGHLDAEIARLDAQIAQSRAELVSVADPYRAVSGAGFQMDASGQPIVDALKQIDSLPSHKRLITVKSIDRSGVIAETWTKCWPFSRKMGIYLTLAHDNALYMLFHLGRTNPVWEPSRGLEFEFDAAGAGGAIIAIGAKFCVGSANIGAMPVAAVLPPLQKTTGRLDVSPVAEGLKYRLMLDRPPYFVLGACAFGFCAGAPVRLERELTEGDIPNLVGNEGEVQLSKLGKVRKFTLDFKFNQAAMVKGGLQVSGPVAVSWREVENVASEQMSLQQ
jgi:hypothetical protein